MRGIELDGAVVAITGGARGIGLQTARAFAAEGARVVIGDLDAEATAEAAASFGGRGLVVDVRSRASLAAFLAAAEEDGPLAVLVSNAGIMPLGPLVDEPDATTAATLEINVGGLLQGLKLALPGMVRRGNGHVVNVASYIGRVPSAGAVTYTASKFAAVGLTQAIADELHGTGVTVTAVMPGAVRTELIAGMKEGGIMPTVDPGRVAAAIVRSCRTRQPLLAVPALPLRGYGVFEATMPQRLVAAVRGWATRSRTGGRDAGARDAYERRIEETARRS